MVLKAAGIPEWRKIFQAEDSDFGAIDVLERLESADFEAILSTPNFQDSLCGRNGLAAFQCATRKCPGEQPTRLRNAVLKALADS